VGEVKNLDGYSGGREWQLLSDIRVAEGHPRTLALIAKAIRSCWYKAECDVPDTAAQFMCLWHAFTATVTPGCPNFSAVRKISQLRPNPPFTVCC
jgi:hypothetical protein